MHSQLCSALLEHYAAQWRDCEVYWRARERSALHGDLMTIIIDSFDRSKLYLPKFPFNRIPKRPAYQAYNRILDLFGFPYLFACTLTRGSLAYQAYSRILDLFGFPLRESFPFCMHLNPIVWGSFALGASLVLTAVLCHGHGCWMYLSAGEGIGCGSSWNWECATCLAIHGFGSLNSVIQVDDSCGFSCS